MKGWRSFLIGLAAVTIIWALGFVAGRIPLQQPVVETGCQAFWSEVLKAGDAENWERASQMSTVYLACRQRAVRR